MRYHAHVIELSTGERKELEALITAGTSEQRMIFRARIILMAAKNKGTNEIARIMKIRPATVSKWRIRFSQKRMPGLFDMAGRGPKERYGKKTDRRILEKLDESPPSGYGTWSGSLLAKELGNVSADYIWAMLRRYGIQLQRRRSWCVSTDPEFSEKAADIVGLYLHPPENAVVISVDEKPHIQALERAQGYLKLPNGRTLTGFSHEYKRHGTTTLFAAIETTTGLVKTGHYNRRRRVDFLDFMNQVVSQHSSSAIHVILDNLNTHKPKHDRWLSRHPNVHFHFTPTHASWLNQIEVWFSILSRRALMGQSFTSPSLVRDAIDRFVEAYNKNAHPFEWTKTSVKQKIPKTRYADLYK